MRVFWYTILFITPTVLVLIYRTQIQEFLSDKGIIRRPPGSTAPATPGTEPVAPTPKPTPGTASTAIPKPIIPSTPEEPEVDESIEQEINAQYPLPTFKPLTEVVGNWQKVPANAFPEIVKLKKPVELSLIIAGKVSGKAQFKVGQSAYPVSLEGNTLTISGSPGERGTQGTIDIDETDFKEQVEQKYNAWKARQNARVHKLRKEAKARLIAEQSPAKSDSAATENPPTVTTNSALGAEPKPLPNGQIPVMVASIEAGDVKEIQLDKIEYWRWLGKDQIGGQEYWAGVVGYVADTIFGEISTEGKALIRNGKVVKWVYSGSEEIIK